MHIDVCLNYIIVFANHTLFFSFFEKEKAKSKTQNPPESLAVQPEEEKVPSNVIYEVGLVVLMSESFS